MSLRFTDSPPPPLIANPDDVHDAVAPEAEDAARRAVRVGARPPLAYVGAGAYGIVFTDRHRNLSFKVGRHDNGAMEEEAEWFRAAARDPFVSKHVPHGARCENGVLVKQFVHGHPGAWSDSRELGELMDAIHERMMPLGWTRPEFKEDSFVRSPRGWILVDASSACRVGRNMLNYAVDVASGRRPALRPFMESVDDLAYYVKRERISERNPRGTIPAEEADAAIEFLRRKAGSRRFAWE